MTLVACNARSIGVDNVAGRNFFGLVITIVDEVCREMYLEP